MRMKSWQIEILLCIVPFLAICMKVNAQMGTKEAPPGVSLCDVLRQPSAYNGKTITVTVRITSTKEGTSLWSPACSKLGVRFHADTNAGPDNGLAALYQQMGDHAPPFHPLIATLTGAYVADYFDEIRHRSSPVFKTVAARDIRRPAKAEFR